MSDTLTLTLAALSRLRATIGPAPKPTLIVTHPFLMKGKAWKIDEEDRLYYFVHPDDIAALPIATPWSAGSPPPFMHRLGGIEVRPMDDETRAVFIRLLERAAAAEAAMAPPILPFNFPG